MDFKYLCDLCCLFRTNLRRKSVNITPTSFLFQNIPLGVILFYISTHMYFSHQNGMRFHCTVEGKSLHAEETQYCIDKSYTFTKRPNYTQPYYGVRPPKDNPTIAPGLYPHDAFADNPKLIQKHILWIQPLVGCCGFLHFLAIFAWVFTWRSSFKSTIGCIKEQRNGNPQDVVQNYAAALTESASNLYVLLRSRYSLFLGYYICTISGLLMPIAVGYIINGITDIETWKIVKAIFSFLFGQESPFEEVSMRFRTRLSCQMLEHGKSGNTVNYDTVCDYQLNQFLLLGLVVYYGYFCLVSIPWFIIRGFLTLPRWVIGKLRRSVWKKKITPSAVNRRWNRNFIAAYGWSGDFLLEIISYNLNSQEFTGLMDEFDIIMQANIQLNDIA